MSNAGVRKNGPGPKGCTLKSALTALPYLEMEPPFPAHGALSSPISGCNATPSIFETASNYVLVARRTNRLLMGCDQCCYEREIHNKLVAGATIGCFPNLYAGLSQNRPDQLITL